MSFDPMQTHPALRSQLIDLYPEPAYYASEMDFHRTVYPPNASIFDPFNVPACSSQSQVPNMAANNSQTQQRDVDGPFSMDLFVDATQKVGPTSFGVLKIRNIPYDVTRSEIVQFLGRSPNIIENHTMGCTVHIIMERPTSKTMDCFVEFQTVNSVYDQIRRHDNLVQSGRHPKLGSRHVHVDVSDQNELLAEMFPRAKSIIWENGSPVVITNDDPYSTGFKGFFTREEMVGLVRHAECPQRSPFSINCLQRTFESMISTLYKFPWYAAELYTLTDRNLLFSTYMSQMCVLVEKVENKNTKGLDQNLLRDFIFAGMNCPGFGERQKHELVTAAGFWGGGVNISHLSCFWPFDLISRKEGIDDETVKFFLDLVERGAEVCGNEIPFQARFIVKPRLPTTAAPENPHFLNNTRFQFNEDSQRLDYGTAMSIEMKLIQDLLTAGYASWKGQYACAGEGYVADNQRQLVDNLRVLNLQRQEILQGDFENELTPRAPISPAQSPKGTTAAISDASGNINLTPTGRISKPTNPTSKPFEPRRRLSDPQQMSGVVGDSPMYLPFRRRTSSTLSLPFPEDTSATNSPPNRTDYVTPTKTKRGARFSVDHTIHEDDEDVFMAINHAKLQKTC